MDMIGRKHIIFAGSIISVAGVRIQVGSNEWKLFLSGRLINAIGFGMLFMDSPVWIGEIVRPELRGFFLCMTNGAIVLRQIILA